MSGGGALRWLRIVAVDCVVRMFDTMFEFELNLDAMFGVVMLFCCIGIKSSHLKCFDMLWLILFWNFGVCEAVCTSCYGEATSFGCKGDKSTCPWFVTLAENAASVAAATGGIIALEKLLPVRFVRLFSKPVLHTLSIICAKPKGGVPYDFDGKTGNQIYTAVKGGYVTQDEAVSELMFRLGTEEAKTSPDDKKIKDFERAITVIQKSESKVISTDVSEGSYLFVLAKLSTIICGDSIASFDLCVEIDDEKVGSGSATPVGSKRYSANLKRPRSYAQMYSLLHQFLMVSVCSGLSTIMAMAPFLDDVVYEPIRTGQLEWPVAFELMICYLRMIENDPGRWKISDIVFNAGGMDTKRAEATNLAKGLYPVSCFRTHGGIPGKTRTGDEEPTKGAKETFKGTITGFDSTRERGCAAWNNGSLHLAKHVDANGKCKFNHVCDQFVTDKGPGGQCLGQHRRSVCDYDSTKKCSKPAK